jgi:hypothetical protein
MLNSRITKNKSPKSTLTHQTNTTALKTKTSELKSQNKISLLMVSSKVFKVDSNKGKKIKKMQPSFNSLVKVAVRVQPQSKKEELENEKSVVLVYVYQIKQISSTGGNHDFKCDHCISSHSTSAAKSRKQKEVYDHLGQSLISQAFQGFNTCLF